MNKIISIPLILAVLTLNSLAYDATKAQELDTFYSVMIQKACADSRLFIKAEYAMKNAPVL